MYLLPNYFVALAVVVDVDDDVAVVVKAGSEDFLLTYIVVVAVVVHVNAIDICTHTDIFLTQFVCCCCGSCFQYYCCCCFWCFCCCWYSLSRFLTLSINLRIHFVIALAVVVAAVVNTFNQDVSFLLLLQLLYLQYKTSSLSIFSQNFWVSVAFTVQQRILGSERKKTFPIFSLFPLFSLFWETDKIILLLILKA